MLTDAQKKALTFIDKVLGDNLINYQITGGLAAIFYGAKRPLADIDIDIFKHDAEKVSALFKEYLVEDWNNDLEGDDDQFDMWVLKLEIDGVPVDISQTQDARVRSIGGEWIELPESMHTYMQELKGTMLLFPIQNQQDLIAYKKILDREVDREDIKQMRIDPKSVA